MQPRLNELPPTLIIIVICRKWWLGMQRRAALVRLGCQSLLRLLLQSSRLRQRSGVSNQTESSLLQRVPAEVVRAGLLSAPPATPPTLPRAVGSVTALCRATRWDTLGSIRPRGGGGRVRQRQLCHLKQQLPSSMWLYVAQLDAEESISILLLELAQVAALPRRQMKAAFRLAAASPSRVRQGPSFTRPIPKRFWVQ